jgi:hypothetical protein
MIEGALRWVLGGIVLLLFGILIETVSPGQPWVAFGFIAGILGFAINTWGFVQD